MRHLVCILCFVCLFPVYGENSKPFSEESSDVFGAKAQAEWKNFEIGRLQLRPGITYGYSTKTHRRSIHGNLLLEYQYPFGTADGDLKWLIGAGPGYMKSFLVEEECPSKRLFFKRRCETVSKDEKSLFYFVAQTGIEKRLGSNDFSASLFAFISQKGEPGYGSQIALEWWSGFGLAFEVFYYKEPYLGGRLFFAVPLKKWFAR